jgi:hypothetical protein
MLVSVADGRGTVTPVNKTRGLHAPSEHNTCFAAEKAQLRGLEWSLRLAEEDL